MSFSLPEPADLAMLLSPMVRDDAAPDLVTSSQAALDAALARVPAAISHTRSWGWGVAFLQDPVEGKLPDVDGPVTVTASGVGVSVRHAQDVDIEDPGIFDENGFVKDAVVTMHIARQERFTPPDRAVVVDTILETPTGTLSLGDADTEIVLPAFAPRTRVVISHDDAEWNQPDEVWIDFLAAGD